MRALGLGLITGAADDDPSAIGTYASAGAALGPSFLWTAPITFPMMFAAVYLSSKIGQVTGKGLFAVIRDSCPRFVLYATLSGMLLGNTIEAAADLGGMAAALALLVPLPRGVIVVATASAILSLQLFGSYALIRNAFRWLALTLLAYVGAALLAKPELRTVLRGTLLPSFHFNREFTSMLVAVIGTTLSTYLYTWQSNEEVEEKIEAGRVRLSERQGASDAELAQTRMDILLGMLFSNAIMYFIMLSTASTLFRAGHTGILSTAAEASVALEPLAGKAAAMLFAIGVVGVGFLALPVMTSGAAYDLCQGVNWQYGLHRKPREARQFYAAIAGFTLAAVLLNFLGLNPMKALVWSGIVQGFSTPPLMLLIMVLTNRRAIMGGRVNGRFMNVLGGLTTLAIFAATIALIATWLA